MSFPEKTNFSEYLKALTLPTDPLYEGLGQNIPTTVECQSDDEELIQSGYSPRRKSRKVFHSAPVSPPQPSRLGGIELLLAASGKYGIGQSLWYLFGRTQPLLYVYLGFLCTFAVTDFKFLLYLPRC